MVDTLLRVLLVGAGGAAGSVARYGVTAGARALVGDRFPVGTLAVNAMGCLVAGVLLALAAEGELTENQRLLLMAGVLGGFTTFSAFGAETFALASEGQLVRAGLNIMLNVFVSLGAVWAGWALFRWTAGAVQ